MKYWGRKRLTSRLVVLPMAALVFLGGILAYTIYTAQEVEAGPNRLGTPQVTLNPGGGILTNGTDGLRFTINADSRYVTENYESVNDGQDGVVYRATRQYCCSAGSPLLNVGGQLYGQAGPAGGASTDWSSIQIISTSGAASVGPRTNNTGNSSATIRYTVERGGLTYTVDRTVSYLYPNDFVIDSYSFTIPEGNTAAVKFYLGGDTAPGSSDQGYGIMLTSPVRSIISLNTSSQIMFGFREIQGDRPFDGATSRHYSTPYAAVSNGGDIGFVETASNHDAGLMMQWNLGSTPGTYTGSYEQFATQQGTNLNAVFAQPRADINEGVSLNISIVNSELESVGGLGYTIALPPGVLIDGAATSSCGGTLSAANGGTAVTLSGVTVSATSNCVVSVPVSASTPGSYAITSANASGITGPLVNNIGVSRLNVAVYALAYATQGGSVLDEEIYELGNTVTTKSTTRDGFNFLGWNTNADGSGTAYAAGATFTMPADDVTLYAQWESIPYSVTFNSAGGSSVATRDNLTTGDEVELDTPNRSGYEFVEWNTEANGSGTGYNEEQPFIVPAANTTLYAIWAKVTSVSYNSQGGSNVSQTSGRAGDNAWLQGAPSRPGYDFLGWNASANGTGASYDQYDWFLLPEDNVTLYAVWEDHDGIAMEVENAAPNNGDGNNDGALDSQQAGVSSFNNPVTDKPVTLEVTSSDECFLSDTSVKASSELVHDSTYTYPLGLLDFTVACGDDSGFTAMVKQYYYDAPVNSFVLRKYLDGQYSTVSGASFDMQTIDGRQVLVATYEVTDGGPLDADGEANGSIVDPAGPAAIITSAEPGAEGSSPAPVSSNSPIIGAPNTGVESKNMSALLLIGGVGAVMVILAASGAVRLYLRRGYN